MRGFVTGAPPYTEAAHPPQSPLFDPDDAVHVLAVLDAARVSARERRAVDVAVGPGPSA